MVALNFPTSPTNGDTYENYVYDSGDGVWKRTPEGGALGSLSDVTITTPLDEQALVYDTSTGNWINSDVAGGVEIASTAPSSPSAGDLWWDSDNGNLYVYYDDGTSQQWVSASDGQATISDTAPAGYNGQLWWNSTEGKMYVYYDDGTSAQWVAAGGPQVTVQATPPTGYQGQMWLDSTDGSMYVYYTDPGGAASSWIGAVSRSGGILQVVSTTKTDTFSTTSTSFTDLTGLSATITPRSTSSKIYAVVDIGTADHSTTQTLGFKVTRGGTDVGVGDLAGSRKQANAGVLINAANRAQQVSFSVLDSPSSTSSLTYQVQCYTVTGTMQINRSHTDTDTASYWRASSSITLFEVAG